LKKEGKTGLKI